MEGRHGSELMSSTHMAAGFVISGVLYRTLVQFSPPNARAGMMLLFPNVLIAGLAGGAFPDLDRLDRQVLCLRLVHRRTLHFLFGYAFTGGLVAALLPLFPEHAWLLGPLAGLLVSAGLHCLMDVYDGVQRGRPGALYEHVTGRWIRGRRLIPFGSAKEWVLYSAFSIGFLVFATYPTPIAVLGSDALNLSLVLYLVTWVPAVIYEWRFVLPKRRAT